MEENNKVDIEVKVSQEGSTTEKQITVKDWIDYEEAEKYPCSIGGLGGFFQKGMRWSDYENRIEIDLLPYYQALFKEIKERDIVLYGDEHQHGNCGVPLFSDNTTACFSYRGFGDIMAAARSTIEDKDYSYMDFYMNC